MLYIQSGDIISGAKRKKRKSLIWQGKRASSKKRTVSLSEVRSRNKKRFGKSFGRQKAGPEKDSFRSGVNRRLRRLRRLVSPTRLAVRLALIVLLVTVFVLELRVLVFDMPLFRIEQIEVDSPEGIQVRDILRIAGIRKNQSSLKFEPEIVARKIEMLPQVKQVNVFQNSMDKVVIEVKERVPVAFVLNNNGQIFEVDEEGYILGERNKKTPSTLPFITGASTEVLESGKCLEDSSITEVLGWLPPLADFFNRKVSEINVSDSQAKYIYTVDGIKIYLNNVEELRSQLPFILRVLGELKTKYTGVEYMDLRYKCGLVIKPERGLL